ncbi:MAG: hypothetical protein R3C05_03445 [Pirellulaceae bacterium]
MFFLPLAIILYRSSPTFSKGCLSLLFGSLLLIGTPGSVGGETIEGKRSGMLRREGTAIKQVAGEIAPSGNRWVLMTGDAEVFRLLENLTLQRVVRAYQQDPADKYWTIDGTVTEFLDDNFIRLTRAARTSKVTASVDQSASK